MLTKLRPSATCELEQVIKCPLAIVAMSILILLVHAIPCMQPTHVLFKGKALHVIVWLLFGVQNTVCSTYIITVCAS